MGTQSTITLERKLARHRTKIYGGIGRFCVAIAVMAASCASGKAQAPLVLPSAIAFDGQGNLYVADAGAHLVRRWSSSGVLTVVAGTGVQGFAGDGGSASAAQLDSPAGLAVDGAGNLYIADTHNHRVRKVAAGTGVIATVGGTGVAGFAGDGGPATAAKLDLPAGLTLDAAGNLFVADAGNHRVRRVSAAGTITTFAGSGVEGFGGDGGLATAAAIDSPGGLAVDAAGNLYIADTHNGRVREVTAATGTISTIAGRGGAQGFGGDGGAATGAALALPRGVSVDAAGNVYVADSANHRVRKISAAGVMTIVAGDGTQGFSGDSGAATAASLDSPRAVALSGTGVLTFADSGNQRVRQVDSGTAQVHTVPWVTGTAAVTLTLSGPGSVVYGSGSLAATVSANGATGGVSFSELVSGIPAGLGVGSLAAGTAAFSLGGLGVGTHTLIATYAGDGTYGAAQSSAMMVTVTPLALLAAPDPVAILYGQPVPALTGTLTGVLPQDSGKVAAVFSTTAATLSPAGLYPITVGLAGSAVGNYTVSATAASVTIARAPVAVGLSTSNGSPTLGAAVVFSVQVASTTSGVPTGSVRLLDGTSLLASAPLSGGAASFSVGTLAVGAHGLTAEYSGDRNFLPLTSGTTTVTVGAGADFTLASSGTATQTIAAGSAATFGFTVATQGGLASPISLAVQGLPLGATASLSPKTLPPGGTGSSFTLTVQTPLAMNSPAGVRPGGELPNFLAFLIVPYTAFASSILRRRRRRFAGGVAVASAGCILFASLAIGCGDRVNMASAANAKTYTLTVTGTATGPAGTLLQHSANVTLEVL